MTIKERLESGVTAEEMMKEFSDELKAVQNEIAAQKDNKLANARSALISAIVDYTIAAGVATRGDITDEDIVKLESTFIELEEEVAAIAEFAKFVKALDEKCDSEDIPRVKVRKLGAEDADKVIEEFLKRLG
jgi:hypothetical protein